MNNPYVKGELLQIQTKNNEVIEGRLFSISNDKTKISIYRPKENAGNDIKEDVCHFDEADVRNNVKVQDLDEITKTLTKLKLSENDYQKLMDITNKYIYINHIDNAFHEAVNDLKYYSYIGLSADGAAMGRKCNMPFLVLSTPLQIYIFDTQVMQHHAFDAGLKDLLESDHPKKIVHDCRKIADCLYHKHNVVLQSVFDTQVGDLIVMRNKTGQLPKVVKSLQDCLTTYLGIPSNTVEEKLDIVQCTERPLSAEIKMSLAKNITFLHELSKVIDNEVRLPLQRGIECYLENLRSCDYNKAWELCGKQYQLPKEFQNAIEY